VGIRLQIKGKVTTDCELMLEGAIDTCKSKETEMKVLTDADHCKCEHDSKIEKMNLRKNKSLNWNKQQETSRHLKLSKGNFLYSAVSSPQDRSKRFTLYFPDRPVHSDTISASLGSIQPYATINARRLLVHISTTVYSQVLIYSAK